jgi:Cdc6-like AAA superfamily ATPase
VCEQKVKDTLRPEICTFDTFIEAKDELLKDSGQWIWHEPVFLDRKKPLLWIYGFPGSGKSFLSCSIIQSLERRFPQCVQDASRVSVTYFFCKDDNPKLKSFNTLLRTVSYQIAKNDPVYAKYVAGLCTLLEDGTSMATLWKRLFVEFFLEKESRSCVFLAIDGLDEAYEDERQIFFRLLKGLVKDHGTCRLNIQVLLVGRHHITEEIEEALGVLPLRLAISASKNSKDIERYVREGVRSSVKLRRLPKSLRKEIVDALSNGANGFFLWAKLMLKEVQLRYHHPSQIRSTLSNLPRGLTSTFQLVVDRFSKTLPDQDIEDLNVSISVKGWFSQNLGCHC